MIKEILTLIIIIINIMNNNINKQTDTLLTTGLFNCAQCDF